MTTNVAKWGNSLGLRLPRSVALEADIHEGDTVDVTVDGGTVVIRPVHRKYTLDELVAGITRENRHEEADWNGPVGREAW